MTMMTRLRVPRHLLVRDERTMHVQVLTYQLRYTSYQELLA